MNYLAHLYLSFENEHIAIGNFIADAVKGRKYEDYPVDIRNGILIHREIDSFTDTHEITKRGKRRLSDYRHYAGVITDIFYDHFLAKNWEQYSDDALNVFTQRNYEFLKANKSIFPEKAHHILYYMERGDWLYNYQFLEGVQFALSGMSKRTSFKSGMERATKNLQEDYDLFEAEFHLFFADITQHIHTFTNQIVSK